MIGAKFYQFKHTTMLWLVSVSGIILSAVATIWSTICIQSIDEEIERVERILRSATNGAYDEQKQLARKYGLRSEDYEFFTWLVEDVGKILKKRKKRAVQLRAILVAVGATIAVLALVWQSLGR